MAGRTLVICEKPTAARRIAQALDDAGGPESYRERGVPYYVAYRKGRELLVVSALGHLYSIVQDGGKWTYPVYGMKWVPAYEASKSAAKTKNFIEVIERLARGVGEYVSACDYDMEGSLIAYNILRYVCGEESLGRANRMHYSTLTDHDLAKSWDEMSSSLDFPIVTAGKARHELDWLFGINLSRALTLSVKNATGYYKTLSIGRVQGPTLAFIKEQEVKVRSFVPTPFWVVQAETEIAGKRYPLEYEKPRVETEEEAREVVKACRGKEGVITSIVTKEQNQYPWPPFSIGDLQREAYRHFGYSPRTTLRAAERLYLDAIISYPRTSSQRLPPSIDIRSILTKLRNGRAYADLAERLLMKPRLRPRQGEKDDPAHPAIYPTGNLPGRLGRVEERVYDLVCRRFMACLAAPAVRRTVNAEVDVYGYGFFLKGSQILEQGWRLFYAPYLKEKEVALPALREGLIVPMAKVGSRRRYTKPPSRYNPGSLLKLMEDEGIGTKATRADIMDTLFKRGYLEGNPVRITYLGFKVAETLGRYSPDILSVEMTRRLERDLELIEAGKMAGDRVVREAIEVLDPILREFKEKEGLIGAEMKEAIVEQRRKEETLSSCPTCGTGEIRVITNPKTGKRFAGCSNYKDGHCSQSYPLPQEGKIKATGKPCPACGAPIVKIIRRGRRPRNLCINLECPSKKGGEGGGNL